MSNFKPPQRFPALDWVAHHARVKPKAIALHSMDSGESRLWGELDSRVGRLAHALRHELELKSGDRVVAIMDGDIRSFELQFACMRAGLIFAPLNFRLAVPELVELCKDLEPALMISDAHWSHLAEGVAEEVRTRRLQTAVGGGSELDRLIYASAHMEAPDDIDPDAVTHIFYTSGTTGTPKGAMSTHSAMVWNAMNQIQFAHVAAEGAHVFTPLPLFHTGGFNSLSNPILFFGGQVSIAARFDPIAAVRLLGNPANQVTHVALPPIMYQMMLESPDFAAADFSALKVALTAGGRTAEPLRAAYEAKGVLFHGNYGSTETGPNVTSLDSNAVEIFKAGSCGQPVKHTQFRLVDEEGRDVPVGEAGEIWVRGPTITVGYWRRDPLDALNEDGWFRTGDVAKRDAEGFVFLVDRVKDMYKSGGENVSSQEVESVLLMHPAIAECAVIGVPDPKWGEVGLAIICPANGYEVTLETALEACVGKLARYKHPRHIAIVDSFPRNATGKISKSDLRSRFRGTRTA